jgi:hypothetical protein
MADDDSIRDQVIKAYLVRAAALVDEAKDLIEEAARLALPNTGFLPVLIKSSPEEDDETATDPDP